MTCSCEITSGLIEPKRSTRVHSCDLRPEMWGLKRRHGRVFASSMDESRGYHLGRRRTK